MLEQIIANEGIWKLVIGGLAISILCIGMLCHRAQAKVKSLVAVIIVFLIGIYAPKALHIEQHKGFHIPGTNIEVSSVSSMAKEVFDKNEINWALNELGVKGF